MNEKSVKGNFRLVKTLSNLAIYTQKNRFLRESIQSYLDHVDVRHGAVALADEVVDDGDGARLAKYGAAFGRQHGHLLQVG